MSDLKMLLFLLFCVDDNHPTRKQLGIQWKYAVDQNPSELAIKHLKTQEMISQKFQNPFTG